MKKLITSVALAATMLSASAADIIDVKELLIANPNATLSNSEDDYDAEYTFGNDFTVTCKSGTTYEVVNVAVTETFFRFCWNYDLSSNIHGGNDSQWIESIVIKPYFNKELDNVKLYASDGEFSAEYRFDADFKYDEFSVRPDSQGLVKINVNVPSNYFILTCSQDNIESITINWTDTKPMPQVEQPRIECWMDPVEAGANVSISTATVGATINASVYVNDVLAANQPEAWVQNDEWSSMNVRVPGKTGDNVRIEAYASKTDWTDSETSTWQATLAMSPAPQPTITKVGSTESYISYLFRGDKLQMAVNTTDDEGNSVAVEGAKVTYTYGWYGDNSYRSEETEASAPVIFTVPEDVPLGANFFIEAYATAEGYRKGSTADMYSNVISTVLDAPTFSHKDGAKLKAGGSLSINRPSYATEIHYTINGGEEQVSDEYSVQIPVTEEITVEAWATGEAPFEPSEKETVTVAPEKFEAWMDVITPSTFGMADNQDSSVQVYNSVMINENTNVSYEYKGGFYERWIDSEYVNCFYMNGQNSQDLPYIRNTVPAVNAAGQEVPVKTLLVDSYQDMGFFVFLSNEKITLTDDMTNYIYEGTEPVRFTVVSDDNIGYDYPDHYADTRVMINLSDLQKQYGNDELVFDNKKYVAIVPIQANQGYYLIRSVIGYTANVVTGAEIVTPDALQGAEGIYNMNGLMVNAENLTPGIYIRIADGKTTKIIVK